MAVHSGVGHTGEAHRALDVGFVGSFISSDRVRCFLFRVSSPATAAVLKQAKDLPRRVYQVDVDVKDLQSNGGIQTVSVRVCQCRNGACVAQDSSSSLGPLGWLAMLLPLALLLLLCEWAPPSPA